MKVAFRRVLEEDKNNNNNNDNNNNIIVIYLKNVNYFLFYIIINLILFL